MKPTAGSGTLGDFFVAPFTRRVARPFCEEMFGCGRVAALLMSVSAVLNL